MLVLGIESTCDETAFAVVREGKEILSNVIASQIDLQKDFGGVVPELAARRHVDAITPLLEQCLQEAGVPLNEIDLIAVAHGPGLIGPLTIGVTAAKALSLSLQKPFIGVNHIEAHLYGAIMSSTEPVEFPALGVVISGGHTALVLMHGIGHYSLIGQSVDDAIGEAFDKVARILRLPYPGGPEIERLAASGDARRYPFKAGKVKDAPLSFSFSGLKTSVLYTVNGQNVSESRGSQLDMQEISDVAASFQWAALMDIVEKSLAAAQLYGLNTLVLGGGVTNNQKLREFFTQADPVMRYCWPNKGLSVDNAAMIAGLGYHCFLNRGEGDAYDLEAKTCIPFGV